VLIVMRHGATEDEVRRVIAVIEEMGYKARPMPGVQRTAVGLVGNDGRSTPRAWRVSRRPGRHPRHQAIQAGEPGVESREHGGAARRRRVGGRPRGRDDRRSLLVETSDRLSMPRGW